MICLYLQLFVMVFMYNHNRKASNEKQETEVLSRDFLVTMNVRCNRTIIYEMRLRIKWKHTSQNQEIAPMFMKTRYIQDASHKKCHREVKAQ